MFRVTSPVPLILLAAGVCGCTSAPRDGGFGEVQRVVVDRTGEHVQWNRLSGDDKAAAESVHALLKEQLSADRAVQIALLNNHSLQATFEDVGIAQADLVQSGLLKNPIFSAAVEFGDAGKGTKLQFSVVEDFISMLQIPLRKKIARAELAQTQVRVAGAVIDLAAETRVAFYKVQAAEQMLELRRTVAAATDASLEIAQRIHAAGNSAPLDLADEEALDAQAKIDLDMAQLEAKRQRVRLNLLMGLWDPDSQWTIAARLPDLPVEEINTENIERNAIAKNLELQMARAEVFAAARMLGIRKNFGLLSEFELGASSEKEIDHTWETGPAFSGPIPIFDQGQAATAAARARLAQSHQRYLAKSVEVRSAARMAGDELQAARSRAEYYQKVILPMRHRIVEQTQDRYNGMLIGPFQLLQAKRDEISAGVEYVQAQRDYWIARSQLQQMTSGRMGDVVSMGNKNAWISAAQ